MPQFSIFDGGNGGISRLCCMLFESFTPIGPIENSLMIAFSTRDSTRGVCVRNSIRLRKITRSLSTFTLLWLFTSAVIGIDWPGTKPRHGIVTCASNGPDAQQKQQKFFSMSNVLGFCGWKNMITDKQTPIDNNVSLFFLMDSKRMQTFMSGSRFRSNGEITVKAIFVSWSNFHGRSRTTLTVYRTWPNSPMLIQWQANQSISTCSYRNHIIIYEIDQQIWWAILMRLDRANVPSNELGKVGGRTHVNG